MRVRVRVRVGFTAGFRVRATSSTLTRSVLARSTWATGVAAVSTSESGASPLLLPPTSLGLGLGLGLRLGLGLGLELELGLRLRVLALGLPPTS